MRQDVFMWVVTESKKSYGTFKYNLYTLALNDIRVIIVEEKRAPHPWRSIILLPETLKLVRIII